MGFCRLFSRCNNKDMMEIARVVLPIAYLELLAALVAVSCFAKVCAQKIVYLYSDNVSAVRWLQKSRCSAGIGFRILAAVELYKYRFRVKISTRHIAGSSNDIVDALSRSCPTFLPSIWYRLPPIYSLPSTSYAKSIGGLETRFTDLKLTRTLSSASCL